MPGLTEGHLQKEASKLKWRRGRAGQEKEVDVGREMPGLEW